MNKKGKSELCWIIQNKKSLKVFTRCRKKISLSHAPLYLEVGAVMEKLRKTCVLD